MSKKSLISRVKTLDLDTFKSLHGNSNVRKWVRVNILNSSDLVEAEVKVTELEAEETVNSLAIKNKIIADMGFAKSVQIDFILLIRSGTKNRAKNKRLLAKLADVQDLLNVGDIESARDELDSVSTNADLSQGAKDMILSKLNAYLGQ